MSQITIHRRERLRLRIAPQAAAAVARPAALDITEIRHFPLREPVSGNRHSLLKVTTRFGLIGWGECGYDPNADLKALQSAWVGKPVSLRSSESRRVKASGICFSVTAGLSGSESEQ